MQAAEEEGEWRYENSTDNFFFLHHVWGQSPLSDSPNPSLAPAHSPMCLLAVFPPIVPPVVLEKSSIFAFSLYLPAQPCASWKFHISLCLVPSRSPSALFDICIVGWIQLPRLGIMMRNRDATSTDFLCRVACGSTLKEDRSRLHIITPNPRAKEAAGLIWGISTLVQRSFRKDPPVGSSRWIWYVCSRDKAEINDMSTHKQTKRETAWGTFMNANVSHVHVPNCYSCSYYHKTTKYYENTVRSMTKKANDK